LVRAVLKKAIFDAGLRKRPVASPGSRQTDLAAVRPRWSARVLGHRPGAGRSSCRRQARLNWGCERTYDCRRACSPAPGGRLTTWCKVETQASLVRRAIKSPKLTMEQPEIARTSTRRRLAHLETARLVLGGQDRQAAVIGKGPGAELVRQRCSRLRRVIAQAQPAERVVDLVVKEGLRQARPRARTTASGSEPMRSSSPDAAPPRFGRA
jgi:hypothetical protein